MKNYSREIIFILSTIFVVFLYILEIPYNYLPKNYFVFLSIFRILYFTIFIIFLIKLKELNIIQYGSDYKEFNLLINLKILISFFIIVGFYTHIFCLIHFFLYLYLFRKSKASFFGIEQSYHQIVGIFFILSTSNKYYSFDNALNLPNIYNLTEIKSLNFLILSISICLISGFYEKINSNIWKSGNALKIFLNLPQIKTVKYGELFSNFISFKSICYLALINQTMLFFLYFDNLRILFYFGELIFSILLITIAPFHFIGETFILIFLFFISIDISATLNKEVYEISENSLFNLNAIDFILLFILLNSLFSVFYKPSKVLGFINRYSLGLYPFKVYTETHVYGIRVFKISGFLDTKIIFDNIFEVYNDLGFVGKRQKWMPRTIHALTYKITDICEKRLNNCEDNQEKKIILNLFKNVENQNKKKN